VKKYIHLQLEPKKPIASFIVNKFSYNFSAFSRPYVVLIFVSFIFQTPYSKKDATFISIRNKRFQYGRSYEITCSLVVETDSRNKSHYLFHLMDASEVRLVKPLQTHTHTVSSSATSGFQSYHGKI